MGHTLDMHNVLPKMSVDDIYILLEHLSIFHDMKNYIFSHKICAVDMIKRKESLKNFQSSTVLLQPLLKTSTDQSRL